MTELIDLIPTLGFPIICSIAIFIVFYKLITRIMDENANREKSLVDINSKTVDALNQVGKSIENSDKINKELSETNKMLLDKFEDKLDNIQSSVEKIIDKMDGGK